MQVSKQRIQTRPGDMFLHTLSLHGFAEKQKLDMGQFLMLQILGIHHPNPKFRK